MSLSNFIIFFDSHVHLFKPYLNFLDNISSSIWPAHVFDDIKNRIKLSNYILQYCKSHHRYPPVPVCSYIYKLLSGRNLDPYRIDFPKSENLNVPLYLNEFISNVNYRILLKRNLSTENTSGNTNSSKLHISHNRRKSRPLKKVSSDRGSQVEGAYSQKVP